MLIKNKILDEIRAGNISLIFRRWKRPGVKAGGTQMTQRGVLGIDSVAVVTEKQITEKDAKAAGFRENFCSPICTTAMKTSIASACIGSAKIRERPCVRTTN